MRSLHTAMKSSHSLPQLKKASVQEWRPNTAKKKKKKKIRGRWWSVMAETGCHFFFRQSFTGGQGQNVFLWAEQRHLNFQAEGQGSPKQAIMYACGCRWHPFCDYSYKSKGEQKRNRSTKESDFVLPCYNHSSCEWVKGFSLSGLFLIFTLGTRLHLPHASSYFWNPILGQYYMYPCFSNFSVQRNHPVIRMLELLEC